MKKLLGIVVLSLLWCNISSAEVNSDLYLEHRDSKSKEIVNFFDSHLSGMASAFTYANAQLKVSKQDLLYCQPGQLSLTIDNIKNFIDDQIEENKKLNVYNGEEPITLLLLTRLKTVFPCK